MYKDYYNQWLEDPNIDEQTKAELRAVTDEKEVEDRFYKDLEFGTAGMRGVIGAGRNRMNIYNVARATQGMADWLNKAKSNNSVTIAYDSRRQSDEFAMAAALVLCANGVKTYLFKTIHSVPQLSFTMRLLKCDAGIVITASHNPKQYNGYKVFGADGGQLGPEHAREITRHIQAVESAASARIMPMHEALGSGLLKLIGEEEDEAYYKAVKGLSLQPGAFARAADMGVVYTPLHGSGDVPVRRVLADMGVKRLFVVQRQQDPDPEFATVSAPNPEAPEAFDLAKELADEKGAGLLLATDPDADRLGVAVRGGDGGFIPLSGNQIGCLLLYYILSQRSEMGTLPDDGLAVKSIVSTSMANTIAADFGVEIAEVLTGFRYIAGKIEECESTKNHTFLFGFEESYGFNAGAFVRDKDAISSAMLLVEAAAHYHARGMTLLDALEELFQKYGYYGESVKSYTLYGKDGMERMRRAMEHLRGNPPKLLAGLAVTDIRDYAKRMSVNIATGETKPLSMPVSDVLYYELENGAWACVRPSGTEPKLKLYVNGSGTGAEETAAMLETLIADFESRLDSFIT